MPILLVGDKNSEAPAQPPKSPWVGPKLFVTVVALGLSTAAVATGTTLSVCVGVGSAAATAAFYALTSRE
jgi:hypothetical protein